MPHLNRAVNDPLIASIDYKAYSYQSAVVGEKDPEKTLDLNKLRFSLDDFQKLSKGTYNAGEFRITDSGKLDIVNNHKTWTIFNHKSVDGTDAYAIRVAFAKAMAAGGLDKNAMKTVRKALGLGPGYTLSSGTAMTPLTRQQVRELIDANITALNARRAPNNQLRTYDQLHAGYSVEEKRDIAAVREEINRTGGAPRILLNAELSDAMAVTKKIPPSKACRRRTPRTTSSSSTNSPPPSNASRTKTPATTGYARTTPNTRRPSLAAPPAWPSPSKAATSSSRRSTTASARASTSASPPNSSRRVSITPRLCSTTSRPSKSNWSAAMTTPTTSP